MTCDKTPDELARLEIERQALEKAARKIEQQNGNRVYMAAWKRAAKIIREMKS